MHIDELVPLDMVPAGEWTEVSEVHGELDWISRLAAMGVRPGSRLQVLRSGSPCLLRLESARLSLRGEAGTKILVRRAREFAPAE